MFSLGSCLTDVIIGGELGGPETIEMCKKVFIFESLSSDCFCQQTDDLVAKNLIRAICWFFLGLTIADKHGYGDKFIKLDSDFLHLMREYVSGMREETECCTGQD